MLSFERRRTSGNGVPLSICFDPACRRLVDARVRSFTSPLTRGHGCRLDERRCVCALGFGRVRFGDGGRSVYSSRHRIRVVVRSKIGGSGASLVKGAICLATDVAAARRRRAVS